MKRRENCVWMRMNDSIIIFIFMPLRFICLFILLCACVCMCSFCFLRSFTFLLRLIYLKWMHTAVCGVRATFMRINRKRNNKSSVSSEMEKKNEINAWLQSTALSSSPIIIACCLSISCFVSFLFMCSILLTFSRPYVRSFRFIHCSHSCHIIWLNFNWVFSLTIK